MMRHTLGDQHKFPSLSFGLWHLGMFHLEPYQSSETPQFGGPWGHVTLKTMYSKMGALRKLVWFQMKHPQVPKVKSKTRTKNLVP